MSALNSALKGNFVSILFLLIALCFSLFLTACQDKTWYSHRINIDGYTIETKFPDKPIMIEQPYHLLDAHQEKPLDMVQWFLADGENSFNLSYIMVPSHLDPKAVAKELLRSMNLKRDQRLEITSPQFQDEYEQNLPALGEEFRVFIGADSKYVLARAKVLLDGYLIVQLYVAGPEGDKNFLLQSERFFEELKIGDTIN